MQTQNFKGSVQTLKNSDRPKAFSAELWVLLSPTEIESRQTEKTTFFPVHEPLKLICFRSYKRKYQPLFYPIGSNNYLKVNYGYLYNFVVGCFDFNFDWALFGSPLLVHEHLKTSSFKYSKSCLGVKLRQRKALGTKYVCVKSPHMIFYYQYKANKLTQTLQPWFFSSKGLKPNWAKNWMSMIS